MGEVSTIGLDIAKSVFQIHGVDVDGAVVMRKRISRAKLLEFFATLPACLVGVEACPTAHYWSRRLGALGHTVRLMPPSYVKAYLKRSKNDANDAAAICEAVTRPSMRFVATKSEQQQSGLMLHRSRQLLVCQRTMLSNAIRGHMAELGIISAKGRNGTAELLEIIADEHDDRIPSAARFSLDVLARQYAVVRAQIVAIEKRIHAWHRSSEEAGGWRKSLVLAQSSLPRWWPRWEIGKSSPRAAVSLRGIRDTSSGATIAAMSADMRGNTDETWSRTLDWLVRNRLLAPGYGLQ
jgi:transposase